MPELRTRVQAALAERYAVQRELGRGETATVYLAEDRQHHRRVVITVLPAALAAAPDHERFLLELHRAGGLDYPCILPLLDTGAADGIVYSVTPCVEGGPSGTG